MSVETSILELIKDWFLVPLAGGAAFAWNHNESGHKALRAEIDRRVAEAISIAKEADSRIIGEIETQRGHTEKLFDKLEEHARRSEDRHVEVLRAIHEGLSRKADK